MANWNSMRADAIDYLFSSRRYVYFTALAFVFFGVIGYVFADNLSFLNNFLAELVSEVAKLEGLDVGLYIFANNLQSAFISLISGVFFGIFPFINILLNGTIIGYVIALVGQEGSLIHIWKLFPHGIFELPAIFISIGLGIKLGMFIFANHPIKMLKQRLYYSMLVFIFFILPLLLLAAIIEGALIDTFE